MTTALVSLGLLGSLSGQEPVVLQLLGKPGQKAVYREGQATSGAFAKFELAGVADGRANWKVYNERDEYWVVVSDSAGRVLSKGYRAADGTTMDAPKGASVELTPAHMQFSTQGVSVGESWTFASQAGENVTCKLLGVEEVEGVKCAKVSKSQGDLSGTVWIDLSNGWMVRSDVVRAQGFGGQATVPVRRVPPIKLRLRGKVGDKATYEQTNVTGGKSDVSAQVFEELLEVGNGTLTFKTWREPKQPKVVWTTVCDDRGVVISSKADDPSVPPMDGTNNTPASTIFPAQDLYLRDTWVVTYGTGDYTLDYKFQYTGDEQINGVTCAKITQYAKNGKPGDPLSRRYVINGATWYGLETGWMEAMDFYITYGNNPTQRAFLHRIGR